MKPNAKMFALVLLMAMGSLLPKGSLAPAQEIGFVEDFALAEDRAKALEQLIPGTEDYYYYHALHYLNTEQYPKVNELLAPWIKRYDYTPRVHEIKNRLMLLTYEQNSQQTLDYLRKRLNLNFAHQRATLEKKADLPSKLDPSLHARERLTQIAMKQYRNLQGFEDDALEWLVETDLDADRRRDLLQRLKRPDYPNLVKLITADLKYPRTGGFGSLGIHRQLLLEQLDALLEQEPVLLNQTHFVNTYLTKLQPNPDVDWRHNRAAKEAYLKRLWDFVERLDPVHNSLKAHVLYHTLVFEREEGVYDHDRFMTYIKLPRHVSYIEPKYMQIEQHRRHAADLNARYGGFTLLPPVGNDEPLVRSYLAHFFVEAQTVDPYRAYISDVYLEHLFAEVKIVNGLGDPERWYAMLPPAKYQALKERIDIDFVPSNKELFKPEEPVTLELDIKNVPQLIVKVFEINTRNYYRDKLREVDTDINLDGLVANEETTYEYDEPPLRRVRRRFEFPSLTEPGTYVVDFIGNGRSSRALIRKGKLHYLSRTTSAGQLFVILDEENEKLEDASLWLSGHEYKPREDGTILVLFTNRPGRTPIILCHGEVCTLDHFQHESEQYALSAGIYVDREALLERKAAQVIIRPSLTVNGAAAPLGALEQVRLVIESVDLDGVSTKKEIEDFELHSDKESVYEFQVPARLAKITFTLSGKVKVISRNEHTSLSAAESFEVNGIDRTEKVEDLHLAQFGDAFLIALLGKSGEVRAERPVQLEIKHEEFRNPVHTTLQTDQQGRISLGALSGIAWVKATGPEGTSHTWHLRSDRHSRYQNRHGVAGGVVEIPYMGAADAAQRGAFSLLELRGDTFAVDRFEALSVENGLLRISNLPAGDYDLLIKESDTHLRIRLAEGAERGGFVLGDYRQLELRGKESLQVARIEEGEQALRVQLVNATESTRVHVFASYFRPAFDAFAHIGGVQDIEPYRLLVPGTRSVYIVGRDIGDEYRYIIDRKYAKKFPGNMLQQPSLLLNPWELRATETGQQVAAEGGYFGGRGGASQSSADRDKAKQAGGGGATDFSSLDFLGSTSAVLVNLRPDEDGAVSIDREALGPHGYLHIVAVDDRQTAARLHTLREPEMKMEDLRLTDALDEDEHFTEQKRISIVNEGDVFVIDDITTAKFQAYDELSKVYALYATLSGNSNLLKFNFILRWPELAPEEKSEKYSEFACHELNFFLYKKDPEFFEQKVRPYLENKLHPTFMDQWLLGQDLSQWLQPWRYEQLNIVERILLSRLIEGERQYTSRHVKELYELTPPDIDRFNRLFDTAVKSGALETEDKFGFAKAGEAAQQAQGQHRQSRLRELQRAEMPAGEAALADRAAAAPAEPRAPGARPAHASKAGKETAARSNRRSLQNGLKRDADGKNASGELEEAKAYRGERRDMSEADDLLSLQDEAGQLAARKQVRRFYLKLEKTKEWAENNYYNLPAEQQNAELVTANAFWRDLAEHNPAEQFLSTNLAEASRNFTEMMFALAVLDLPFEAAEHKTEYDNAKMTLTAGSPMVVYHQEIREAQLPEEKTQILVSQNFFRHGDRYRYENGERLDKFVDDEFLVHTVYGCQVVMTNPTSSQQKLDVLLQVPLGAVPVLAGKYTRSVHVDLSSYNTTTFEYYFYFPTPGNYPHYPVHVAKNQRLIAFALPTTLKVVEKLSKIDTESWDYVSQFGSDEEVLNFLRGHNLQRLNLEKIAFRMKDREFFDKATALLTQRHAYHHTLYSYGILHNDIPVIQTYLQHATDFVQQCGLYLDSRLLTIDPVLRKMYQHLDYRPLVNARTHQLGRRRQIVNDAFRNQYHELLRLLSYRQSFAAEQQMAVVYYMLLQDRIDTAMEFFAAVNPEQLQTQLQYEYFSAYLDFYSKEPKVARVIAEKHADHPVERWENRFESILAQLDEIEGADVKAVDTEDRSQSQTELAATEPTLAFEVEAKQITMHYQNLKQVRINYYLMDVELLFSRNPFVQEFSGGFSYIRPNATQTVDLPAEQATHTLPLPEQFHNTNVLVEVVGEGITQAQAYYSNSLSLQVIENYGQVRLTKKDDGRPLVGAYVKVYAQTADGNVKFYKDGYTDLRGRFDYVSLNTGEVNQVRKFSILVLSTGSGAVVREARPPKQ